MSCHLQMFSNADGDTFEGSHVPPPLVRLGQGDLERDFTPTLPAPRKRFDMPEAPSWELALAIVWMAIGAVIGTLATSICFVLWHR